MKNFSLLYNNHFNQILSLSLSLFHNYRCTEGLVEQKCGTEAVEFMHILLRMALSKVPDIVCQGKFFKFILFRIITEFEFKNEINLEGI